MTKPFVILASSRSDGNTRSLAERVFPNHSADFVDLNQIDIGYFSYTNSNASDDFLPLLESVLNSRVCVLATPLYWYTMSAQAKTFIDRLSDVLLFYQDKGRRLRGSSFAVLTTGTEPSLPASFDQPFELTCNYLGIRFLGSYYVPCDGLDLHYERCSQSPEEFSRYLLAQCD
ncbi:MAG: NAD(P)H-dependent oxidoreductase [Pirellula sp.]